MTQTRNESDAAAEWAAANTPPNDLTAERGVLGSMMLSPAVADELSEVLRPADFYRPAHAAIYRTILALAARGIPPDAVAVTAELDQAGELAGVGGVPYVHTLLESTPSVANGAWYAGIVVERAGRRRLIEAGTKMIQIARGPDDLAEIREAAAQAAYEATTDHRDRALIETVGDLVGPAITRIEDIAAGRVAPGIKTGLYEYDQVVGGHKPGQLVIPAGRTSMGKSVVTQNWLLHGVRATMRPHILFSVEMSKQEMMDRVLAQVAQVPLNRIIEGTVSAEHREKLRAAELELLTLPLVIVDTCRTVPAIRSFCRRYRQRMGDLAQVGVDYLQRLQAVGRHEDRHVVVGRFANDLKDLAQDMEMVVLAPCQLNRGPETRPTKNGNVPKLSDLRESGDLEQTADIVVLLHRPDYYDKASTRQGQADFNIAKHRNGPTSTITVQARLYVQEFCDMPMLQPQVFE